MGVGRYRCTGFGKGSILKELRGGFGWYCFVFVLDTPDPDWTTGIPCMGIGHGRRVLLLYPLQAEIVRSCPSPSVVRQPFLRIVAIPARSDSPGCPARPLAAGGQSAPLPPSLRRELNLGTLPIDPVGEGIA